MALWGGVFREPTDEDLRALNDSIDFDRRMYAQDIHGSIAYARALADAGVITDDEAAQIVSGLEAVRLEFETGGFVIQPGDEDIHTAVERRLTELIGPVGGKLHTGRSRNDQVATDFRLWVLDEIGELDVLMTQLQRALLLKAEKNLKTLMPGYTHLQPAQPITAAHWLLSFFWMLERDRDRLCDTQRRTGVMPLGSGALSGTPFAINRDKLATELGMASYSHNSLDAVSDRDFAAELIFDLTLMATHLSRLAEDIIIYSNPLFGFIRLDDRYSTGSSLMPQKRNADPMELTRGKTGRLIGHLAGFLATLKGLPSAYNKDLQEDKEPVFDAVDTTKLLLPVLTAIIQTLQFNANQMQRALSDDMLATDLAEYLVMRGVPFREAHHVVGAGVRQAAEAGIQLSELSLEQWQALSPHFGEDFQQVFDFAAAVERRQTTGGTSTVAVQQQIEEARSLLDADSGDQVVHTTQ